MKNYSYKIRQAFDHFNSLPLFYVAGINNEYFGEYHENKKDAKKELNELLKK